MKPHRTDGSSLLFGLLFLAVVIWWAIVQASDMTVGLVAIGWLVAAFLVGFGVIGVVAAIRSGRDSSPPK